MISERSSSLPPSWVGVWLCKIVVRLAELYPESAHVVEVDFPGIPQAGSGSRSAPITEFNFLQYE
jgi:hypothetical protein